MSEAEQCMYCGRRFSRQLWDCCTQCLEIEMESPDEQDDYSYRVLWLLSNTGFLQVVANELMITVDAVLRHLQFLEDKHQTKLFSAPYTGKIHERAYHTITPLGLEILDQVGYPQRWSHGKEVTG